METITIDKENLEILFGQLIGHGIDSKDRELCEAVRKIENLLFDQDYQEEFNEFQEASMNEGYQFIIE